MTTDVAPSLNSGVSSLANFSQTLDRGRPHRLLDEDPYGRSTVLAPKHRAHLVYRYTDTGQSVVVPNVPCNQSPASLAATLRAEALKKEEEAAKIGATGLLAELPRAAEQIKSRLLGIAGEFRSAAAQLESSEVQPDASASELRDASHRMQG